MQPENLMLSEEQVAELLAIPFKRFGTVYNLHRVGILRGVKIGAHLRWRRSDVVAYVKSLSCVGSVAL